MTEDHAIAALGGRPSVRPASSPARRKEKPSAGEQLGAQLRKIGTTLANAGPKRSEQTASLLEALGVTLAIIERAERQKAINWRKALRSKIKRSVKNADRKPKGESRAVLEVVKICFPEKTLSDWSRYAGFLVYCLIKQWDPAEVETKFRGLKKELQSVNVLARRGRTLAKKEGWPVIFLPRVLGAGARK